MSEDYHYESPDDIYTHLSDSYEQLIRSNRRIRRFGKVSLVAFPVVGVANFIFANQEFASQYVAGSAIAGLVIGIGAEGFVIWNEKKVIDPIIEANIRRFEEETDL